MPLHRAGDAVKGDILFHEREYPPFEPPRERFALQASSLKSCVACRIGCLPGGVAIRLGLLLSSLSLCLRFVTLTQFPSTTDFHCFVFVCRGGLAGTRCNMEADGRRKLVRTSTSWAERHPQGVCRIRKAAKLPTAVQCAARAALQDKNCQCAGSRGKTPCLSLGVPKGVFSLEREYPL